MLAAAAIPRLPRLALALARPAQEAGVARAWLATRARGPAPSWNDGPARGRGTRQDTAAGWTQLPASVPKAPDAEAARAFLDAVAAAVAPMVPTNAGMSVTRSGSDLLVIAAGDAGSYYVENKDGVLQLTSPVSGVRLYQFDAAGGRWLGEDDDHDFVGLLTRDLLRHSTGCPVW